MDKFNFGEAQNLVKKIASASKSAKAYMSSDLLSNRSVESVDGMTRTSPYNKFWLGFVDLNPNKAWTHNCKYVFINEYGSHCVKNEILPPVLFDNLEEIL